MRRLLMAMLITVACWVLAGCRSCKTQEPASTPPPGAPSEDTPATPPSAPRTEASQAPEPVAVPEPTKRAVAAVEAMPVSFWNLDVRKHALIRAKTRRLLEIPEGAQNPMDFPEVTLAVLDIEGGGKERDFFDHLVEQLFQKLLDQKVFTAAVPLIVFWDALGSSSKPRWSAAVPVADDAKVSPPLRLHRMPAFRAHVLRIPVQEARKYSGIPDPKNPEKRSVFDVATTGIRAMAKKNALTVEPAGPVLIRLPDIRDAPMNPESLFEGFIVGKGPPPPSP